MKSERSPLSVINETFTQQSVSPEDLVGIEKFRAQGRSPGASVALHMLNESSDLYSGLALGLNQEPKPSLQEVNEKLIAIVFYKLPARSLLDAEEVIRSGEPELNASPSEEKNPMNDLVVLSLGSIPRSLRDEVANTVAETQLYLKRIRYGDILKRTNSPIRVVDSATQDILSGLERQASLALERNNDVQQRNLAIAAISCIQSKMRFRQLYEAAQKAS